MKNFILLLQFLTRIPININLEVNREDFADAVKYFPLVGFVIGVIDLCTIYLFSKIFSAQVSAVLLIIVHTVITGGLHLDGLGDTVDGIYSGRSKERVLEIMKDSRSGTFGVIALIVILMLKFSCVASLSNYSMYRAILLSPIIARSVVTILMYKRRYAREHEGLGDLFIGKISKRTFFIALILGFISSALIGEVRGLIAYFVALLFAIGFRNYIEKKIDGITGDILGASIELNEAIVLLCFVANLNILNF
ncbi:cobalamin-5'-phosphate synthase [Clostridium cavendishii DSM 21758]|uniref:Adenosylcobinamide-GDP ribazoletransferase n=1 Tax=Clostridium cavendishii DSM 21758 TaxID=1121302 RepID=A0A1M6T8V3_9CLOT|nr:adenosylcobinamide-GDP ribazoletransferase [Clostridium cavendishii]SHK53427.1 cobalamin-5'-phosphate synthase [Clostridium cavendishii DSM 21758]